MTHDNQPSTESGPEPTFTQFPPVPLLSGDTFRDDQGEPHTIASVAVTLTGEDGTTMQVPLEYAFGGWWVPKQ